MKAAYADDEVVGVSQFEFPRDDEDEFTAEVIRQAQDMTRDAIQFILGIVAQSRTGRSALLKLACIDSLLGGPESSQEIAKRFRVSVRLVQRLTRETREEFFSRKFVS